MLMKLILRHGDTVISEMVDEGDNGLLEEVGDALSDIIDALFTIDDPPAQGYFPDTGYISYLLHENVKSRLVDVLGEYTLVNEDECSKVDLLPIVNKIVEEREMGYSSNIDIGYCVISMLKKFLVEGRWHYGLRRSDGAILESPSKWPAPQIENTSIGWRLGGDSLEPVIWFGLDGEAPIDCWTLDKNDRQFVLMPYIEGCNVEFWKSFWFNNFWTFDWNVLLNKDDVLITWMFAECGMDEPVKEFEMVKKQCPIQLIENDSAAVLCKKIDDLFLNSRNAMSHDV